MEQLVMKESIVARQHILLPPRLYPPPKHHTVSDWDRNANAQFVLDDEHYISAPRCLKLSGPGSSGTLNTWLCRTEDTRNLPQGRLISDFFASESNPVYKHTFRNQAALGVSDLVNCYVAEIYKTYWRLMRYVNSSFTERDTGECSFDWSAWEKFRLTWWNSVNPEGQEALAVMLDIEVGEEWVQQGDYLYDQGNMWKDSAINRCGPGVLQATNRYYWLDDTEIWGPS